MLQIRVSLGPLAAVAAILCVLGLDAPAQASRQDFIVLPQSLVQDCPKADARVPLALDADRMRRIADFTAGRSGPCVQGGAEGAISTAAGQAFVPGLDDATASYRRTTRISASYLVVADRAADAGPLLSAMASGETRAERAMASAALIPSMPGASTGMAEATSPAIQTPDILLAASGTVTTSAEEPQDGNQAGDGESDGTKGDDGQSTGASPSADPAPEFSGSASQASPDLDSNAEKALIQNGWQ